MTTTELTCKFLMKVVPRPLIERPAAAARKAEQEKKKPKIHLSRKLTTKLRAHERRVKYAAATEDFWNGDAWECDDTCGGSSCGGSYGGSSNNDPYRKQELKAFMIMRMPINASDDFDDETDSRWYVATQEDIRARLSRSYTGDVNAPEYGWAYNYSSDSSSEYEPGFLEFDPLNSPHYFDENDCYDGRLDI